jgi:hypothetical protein
MTAIARHLRALAATWTGRFILAFVAVQLLLPLRYYAANRDPHDERFAWRMFSPMRMSGCTPTFVLDGHPMDLAKTFHEAWIQLAERGRFVVVEDMAARVCHDHPGSAVTVTLACSYLDRDAHTYGPQDMCKAPSL